MYENIAYSINGVPIRLTAERWLHIVENHDDMAGHYEDCLDIIEEPDCILRGEGGALIAIRGVARHRYLAVVYKELSRRDGFVISALSRFFCGVGCFLHISYQEFEGGI